MIYMTINYNPPKGYVCIEYDSDITMRSSAYEYIRQFMAIFPNNAGVQEESNNFGISFTKY